MLDPILTLEISPFRRFFGVGVFAALGITLIYSAAMSLSGSVIGIVGLIIFGGLASFAGLRLYRATNDKLFLTPDGIFTKSGDAIALLENVKSVDRGFFAFKPSNGFLLRLDNPTQRGWAPGLWWRFGKSVGIGGATSPGHGKAMADMVAILISDQRDLILDQYNDQS